MASKSTSKVIAIKNLDKEKIKWNSDFVIVSYKGTGNKTIKMSLTEYWTEFQDQDKPELETFKPLQIEENVIALLDHYNLSFRYNVIRSTFDVFRNNKCSLNDFEYHLSQVRDMATKHCFNITKERLKDILIKISLDNKYNPIENYLKQCHKYYLNNPDNEIFDKIAATIETSSINKKWYLKHFFLQMVFLACCKEDSRIAGQFILVLQGGQSIGKTTWFQKLLPEKLVNKYFLGGRAIDLNNKDHIIETNTNWLVEMGEISTTFRKTDQENLKNFITAFKDRYRLPYHAEYVDRKRRTTFCGTTNDFEYLRDVTGNRRYLTLPCTKINSYHDIDVDMLWGYFYQLYLNGERYHFTPEENEKISRTNEQYLNKPESLILIEDLFLLNKHDDTKKWMLSKDAFNKLSLEEKSIVKNPIGLGKILSKHGIQKKSTKKGTLYNIHPKWDNI